MSETIVQPEVSSDPESDPDFPIGEGFEEDLREPIIQHLDGIVQGAENTGLDIHLKIDDEQVPAQQQIFEPGPPGWLVRKAYDHKGVLISVGAISVGTLIGAVAARKFVSKHKNK